MRLLSLDIGGSFIKYGVFEGYKLIMSGKEKSEGVLGRDYIVKNVSQIINNILENYEIEGIAISTAGIVDTKKGKIVHAGPTIPNYTGFNWKDYIFKTYKLPCQVENDVNCAGLSEYLNGAAVNEDLILSIAVGTGIGASFIKNGQVYHGASNSACEVGYLKIDGKNFEDIASTSALVEYYKNLSSNINSDGKLIFDLAKKGDEEAIKSIDYMVDNLCKGIANITYVLNPKILILGGGIMEQEEYLRKHIEEKLDKYIIPIIRESMEIRFAKNGNLAGVYGAIYNYYQNRIYN